MRNETLVLIGWILFMMSALSFIVSSYKSGDPWALAGALLFFVACLVFLAPYFRHGPE